VALKLAFMRKIIKIFILVLGTCFTIGLNNILAQEMTSADRKSLFKADKAFDMAEYLTAYNTYKQIYVSDSNDLELNYKMGVCAFELKKYRSEAKKYFDKVSYKRYPEVDYYLGMLNHLMREYETAVFHFGRYKKRHKKYHSTKQVDDLISKCNTAVLYESIANTRVQIFTLGENINTEYDEYTPLIPADESFILFTSRRKNKTSNQPVDAQGEYIEDIYISRKDSSGWLSPTLMDSTFNTPVHDAATGLSADGEKLFIYRTSADFRSGDIYESYFAEGAWSKPFKLGTNVNSESGAETSASYSSQGDIIFFSSDIPGGYGGKDLYMAKKLPNGKWGESFNLGPTINTEYDEDAPFAHALGNVLFFSSQGHRNMGGYDVFRTEFDDAGNFSVPKNLGYPINTVGDDIFFVLNPDGSRGYLSSGRDGGLGGQDIYGVSFMVNNTPLDVYNLYVLDEKTNQIVKQIEIEVTDLKTKKTYGQYKSNEHTGKVLFISESKKEFQVTVKAEEYEPFVTNVVFYDFNREKFFTLKKK
jgi:tetratricopeptide (TPR) repeat protein